MGSKLEQASDRTASEKGKMVPWYLASGHGDVLPPAVDMSDNMGHHYVLFWCSWALKVSGISFGMFVFDRRALMK